MADEPFRERFELGLKLRDDLGTNWVTIAGEDFWGAIERALRLTDELGADWVTIYCQFGKAGPLSSAEIARRLRLDEGEVNQRVKRLEEEGLIQETPFRGMYALARDAAADN